VPNREECSIVERYTLMQVKVLSIVIVIIIVTVVILCVQSLQCKKP